MSVARYIVNSISVDWSEQGFARQLLEPRENAMTAKAGRKAQVRMVTAKEARKEVKNLLSSVGMSRRELERRGQAWELDANQRGVLADIRGLEFLIKRADTK